MSPIPLVIGTGCLILSEYIGYVVAVKRTRPGWCIWIRCSVANSSMYSILRTEYLADVDDVALLDTPLSADGLAHTIFCQPRSVAVCLDCQCPGHSTSPTLPPSKQRPTSVICHLRLGPCRCTPSGATPLPVHSCARVACLYSLRAYV
ncbi:hypothetical protein EDB89DRAFT_1537133 [Lactarius sanguifluus]|nr:hypothetical protein EDB89DRAFT_1537133 [Lactarius sanguifluus]